MIEIGRIFNIDIKSPFDLARIIMNQIISTDLKSILLGLYDCDSETLEYILQRPKLMTFLITEAYENIRRYFPTEELVLSIHKDPEDSSKTVVVYIITKAEPKDALKQLKQLDNEWWIKRASEFSDLCITIRSV